MLPKPNNLTFFQTVLLIPTYIGIYCHRLIFVFSMYCLLFVYGLFSDKKKVVPYKYTNGEHIENTNLIHKFTNLQIDMVKKKYL